MTVKSYRDLVAWQKGVALVTDVYRSSESFPKHQLYVITAQMQRAALSVPSNIAEGQGRGSTRDFIHFLGIAKGSLYELETQILIALNLNYLPDEDAKFLLAKAAEVGRVINGLIQSLENKAHAAGA